MKQSKLPKGWGEAKAKEVLAHYESQGEEEALSEDEAAFEDPKRTTMEITIELVPAVRKPWQIRGRNFRIRRWLKSLPASHKKAIGEDIKTVQFGWPLGMPLVKKINPYLWEVRTNVPDGISRVVFTVDGYLMILLHGFIKKTVKLPKRELNTARSRLRQYQEAGL